MPTYVVFQLHGLLASWGEIAVGENRPTSDHPSRSALLGLIAGAMGIRRADEQQHAILSRALSFAVAVVEGGTLVRDYHTVQVPSQGKHMVGVTRRRELQNAGMNTIVSTRDYRCDAWYLAAVLVHPNNDITDPQRLAASLRKPVFVPYLGRKSCPPALPL
ncbi:MAG: type I-E CRISPR-associated protein Cas5/CasD, partial [Chitinivibrionales bacterium]|nr:type I-E CRISPR-associated protein Cas5/CasD [Chitinivibrionales bacterium]